VRLCESLDSGLAHRLGGACEARVTNVSSPPSEERSALDQEVESFTRGLIDRGARIRLPELFAGDRADALWWVPNRQGVSVIALRTPSFTREQLVDIMTYRLVQYLLANQLDPQLIFDTRMEHEPLSNASSEDIHILAGAATSGEILCYVTIKSVGTTPEDATLRATDRPLFPVEQVFGWGVYNRMRLLPDLPIKRVREAGRFVKNQQHDPQDELIVRAPIEIVFAWLRLLAGLHEFDVYVGDLEEGVAKKSLDFFHLPLAMIHGVVPYAPEGSYGFLNYQTRTRYPFALLAADIPKGRLTAIEQALTLPGKKGIMALLAMKNERSSVRSSLEPPEGLAALTDAHVPQQGVAMTVRRQCLEVGNWLRRTNFFHSLSVSEAAVLGTFLARSTAAPGEAIVRQGEGGDDLYLIESGQAEVQTVTRVGQRVTVATLGPGDCFGEIALVIGGERTADVIATTPIILLRLTRDAYARYLAHLVDVESEVTRTALVRTRDTLRTIKASDP